MEARKKGKKRVGRNENEQEEDNILECGGERKIKQHVEKRIEYNIQK